MSNLILVIICMLLYEASGYQSIRSFKDCKTCIDYELSNFDGNNWPVVGRVCKNDNDESASYCCKNDTLSDNTTRACNYKWCSNMAISDTMKYTACSYHKKKCN